MRSSLTANFSTCHDPRAPLVIVAVPALDAAGKRVPARFSVFGTTVLMVSTPRPFLDGARVLLGRGVDPDATVILKHLGSEVESLRSRIGPAAELTVDEGSTPRFKHWKPFSRGAVQPSMRGTGPARAEGHKSGQNDVSVRDGVRLS